MASFSSLPTEILRNIIKFVHEDYDEHHIAILGQVDTKHHSVFNLVEVNRQIRKITLDIHFADDKCIWKKANDLELPRRGRLAVERNFHECCKDIAAKLEEYGSLSYRNHSEIRPLPMARLKSSLLVGNMRQHSNAKEDSRCVSEEQVEEMRKLDDKVNGLRHSFNLRLGLLAVLGIPEGWIHFARLFMK